MIKKNESQAVNSISKCGWNLDGIKDTVFLIINCTYETIFQVMGQAEKFVLIHEDKAVIESAKSEIINWEGNPKKNYKLIHVDDKSFQFILGECFDGYLRDISVKVISVLIPNNMFVTFIDSLQQVENEIGVIDFQILPGYLIIILEKKNKTTNTKYQNKKSGKLLGLFVGIKNNLIIDPALSKEKVDEINLKLINYQLSVAQLENENQELNQLIKEKEKKDEEKNMKILERLDIEERTLKKFRELIYEYNRLEARYYNVSKKYELLSNAKLGKLTIKYWKKKKRIPDDF